MRVIITWHPQTELAINTHTMVSDIHRTIVQGQEGNGDKLSVSDIHISSFTERPLTIP